MTLPLKSWIVLHCLIRRQSLRNSLYQPDPDFFLHQRVFGVKPQFKLEHGVLTALIDNSGSVNVKSPGWVLHHLPNHTEDNVDPKQIQHIAFHARPTEPLSPRLIPRITPLWLNSLLEETVLLDNFVVDTYAFLRIAIEEDLTGLWDVIEVLPKVFDGRECT